MEPRKTQPGHKGQARPFIVPVFLPQSGCPHQCVFCNQQALTGTDTGLPSVEVLEAEINRFLGYRRDSRANTEISFFGGNFLGQPPDTVTLLLALAEGFVRSGRAHGIRFSTRPDTIDKNRLALLSGYTVGTVEIGAQSMDDPVLNLSGRGHSSGDTARAVMHLKRAGYGVGLQMMVGLPGQSAASALDTGRRIAALEPDFVRIYPALVIRGSRLETWYKDGRYEPLDLDRCIALVKQLFLLFSDKGIPVIRIGLQANEGLDTGKDLVAGPYHPAMGQMVASEILFDKAVAAIASSGGDFAGGIHLIVHPRMISTMRGQKNVNIKRLQDHFPNLGPVRVIAGPNTAETDIVLVRAKGEKLRFKGGIV